MLGMGFVKSEEEYDALTNATIKEWLETLQLQFTCSLSMLRSRHQVLKWHVSSFLAQVVCFHFFCIVVHDVH